MSRGSAVGIANTIQAETSDIRIPACARDFAWIVKRFYGFSGSALFLALIYIRVDIILRHLSRISYSCLAKGEISYFLYLSRKE